MVDTQAVPIAEQMAEAAQRVLDTLDASQRAVAQMPFEVHDERERWFYTPTDHGGLRLHDMTPPQQEATHRLVATGLSRGGYVTAAMIMGLENVLDVVEGFRSPFPHLPRSRDPNGYSLTIFGEPGGAPPWAWRFGGHHISLNFLLHPGGIGTMPLFFGANPAMSEGVGPQVLRPLGPEEDLGRELFHLLDGDQQQQAIIARAAPRDLVTGNRSHVSIGNRPLHNYELVREEPTPERIEASEASDARFEAALGLTEADHEALELSHRAKGLPARGMTAGQQEALQALLQQYVRRMPDAIAEAESQRLRQIPLEELGFAWAGGIERGEPHYYRVQGPGLLVEYDNTQNDANHIHTVWRDPQRDFGRDLLAEHYAGAH